MSKRVGIWIRVSTEDQAQGDSPQHHEHRARAYAELKDWAVIEIYHLEAVSGKAVLNHAEAQRMLADIRRGHISGLIFSKLARLARNTRELLEFADIFQKYNADLTSLDESIDTSTPVGRFFYTLIAAMAEWERGEIASRVKASVPIRAKLGKPLGGEAPFGYRWENKELVLDPNEAPVRRLVHELFVEYKRKHTVAQLLNTQGYRTRHGQFTDTSVDRMLRDPIAKGMRRTNYTQSTGDNKHWRVKAKEEWVFVPAPRIITDELWDACNQILDEMGQKHGKVRRKGVHLFSGIVACACGAKMYMRTRSPRYVCPKCNNKIVPDDLEAIFHEQLERFLFSDVELERHLELEKKRVVEKEELLATKRRELLVVKQKVARLLDLYQGGDLPKETFREHFAPLEEQERQIEQAILTLESQIDTLKMHSLSGSQVLYDARNLNRQWGTFTLDEKRRIIETITSSVIVGKEDIEINLSYIPSLVSTPETALEEAEKGAPEALQAPGAPGSTALIMESDSLESSLNGATIPRNLRDSSTPPA